MPGHGVLQRAQCQDTPGLMGISSAINGGTHISLNDMGVFCSMPGMTVIEPSDGLEMEWAIRKRRPWTALFI